MTEESYQECRKVMRQINYRRGIITACKAEVAKWTKMEMAHRSNLEQGKADGARKRLEKSLIRLENERKRFSEMVFPDSNIQPKREVSKCKLCGCDIAKGNDYCGECMCEDDSYI